MAFQILNQDNQPIGIHALDKEAADFWSKPVDTKSYADPFPEEEEDNSFAGLRRISTKISSNWFDKIGWMISEGTTSWDDLEAQVLAPYKSYLEYDRENDLPKLMEEPNIGGIINLIRHWKSLGYTPKQIKD